MTVRVKQHKSSSAKMLKRLFGGEHPVRDADKNEGLMLMTTDEDWQKGVRRDPRRCAYARAYRRVMSLPDRPDYGLAILKQFAYAPVPSSNSPTGMVVLRFSVKGGPHVHWDKGRKVTGGIIYLRPPRNSDRLEEMREKSKDSRARLKHGIRMRPFLSRERLTDIKVVPRVRGGLYHHHHVVIKRKRTD
jgi:hypothetical protein